MFWRGQKKLTDNEIITLIKKGGTHKKTAIDALNRINIGLLNMKAKQNLLFKKEEIFEELKRKYKASLLILIKEIWIAKSIKFSLKDRFVEIFEERCEDIITIEKIKIASKNKEEQREIVNENFENLTPASPPDELKKRAHKKAVDTFIKIITNKKYLQQKKDKTLFEMFSTILKNRVDDENIIHYLKSNNETKALELLYKKLEYQIFSKGLKYQKLDEDDLREAFYKTMDEVIQYIRGEDFRGEVAIKTIFEKKYNWRCIDVLRRKEKKVIRDDEIEEFDQFN